MFDIKNLVVNNSFISIKNGPDEGLWKVIGDQILSDGENTFHRIKIDKDLGKLGDEKTLEYYTNSQREVTILKVFSTFPRSNAESWPPPREVRITDEGEEIIFNSFNKETGLHEPLIAYRPNYTTGSGARWDFERSVPDKIPHWEYQNAEGNKFLSIYEEDGMISMNLGYSMSTGFLNLI